MADTRDADINDRLVVALLRQNYSERMDIELMENAQLRAALGQVVAERDEALAKLAALQAATAGG